MWAKKEEGKKKKKEKRERLKLDDILGTCKWTIREFLIN